MDTWIHDFTMHELSGREVVEKINAKTKWICNIEKASAKKNKDKSHFFFISQFAFAFVFSCCYLFIYCERESLSVGNRSGNRRICVSVTNRNNRIINQHLIASQMSQCAIKIKLYSVALTAEWGFCGWFITKSDTIFFLFRCWLLVCEIFIFAICRGYFCCCCCCFQVSKFPFRISHFQFNRFNKCFYL